MDWLCTIQHIGCYIKRIHPTTLEAGDFYEIFVKKALKLPYLKIGNFKAWLHT